MVMLSATLVHGSAVACGLRVISNTSREQSSAPPPSGEGGSEVALKYF